jgi:hypothetical protein
MVIRTCLSLTALVVLVVLLFKNIIQVNTLTDEELQIDWLAEVCNCRTYKQDYSNKQEIKQ